MSRWIIASQDIGIIHKQTQALTMALQAQNESITEALSRALMVPDWDHPTTGGRGACFRCIKKGPFKRDCLPCPQWRVKPELTGRNPPLPLVPDAGRDTIGGMTVDQNSIRKGGIWVL